MESPLSLIPLGSTIGAAGPVTDSWSLLYRSPPCQLLSYKDVGSALRISHVRKNSPYHHRKDSPCHDKWREKKREKEGSLTPPPRLKLRRVRTAKEKGTWPNIMSLCLMCAGEGKLLGKMNVFNGERSKGR